MRADRNGPSTNTRPYGPEIDAMEHLVSGAAWSLASYRKRGLKPINGWIFCRHRCQGFIFFILLFSRVEYAGLFADGAPTHSGV